ncbi:DUF885 domain-containing protein [Marinitenerispora sediminis]|uniref:DUF885 domain-containing protein n=1 Tax=Marinitenerispora sediminis TaxID=1931232 RepID=A0A368T7F6_9ACTN|nr:DUF885 domain-containing protein [Marinitenerispora sediminis]RCV57033.1 DUF885 domain-containing protein [Marinitenerispora sediminis]RCV60003.1 DUF885 domain-containing protein [Marinitenerispora sediminis]
MTDRFRAVGDRILEELLSDAPEWAGELGDLRFADRLADHSADADGRRVAMLADALGALDEIDDTLLPLPDRVDLELLRSRLTADMWRLSELRQHTWDPLRHSPGDALYQLIARDTLPAEERLRALAARCRAVPDFLATARARLDDGPGMPRPHVETAVGQTRGTAALLGPELDALLESAASAGSGRAAPALRREVEAARETARAALAEHASWLENRLETAAADPRLGARAYAAQLWYTLDSELTPDTLLTRAESDLIATEEEIAEVAAAYDGRPAHIGQVRAVLDRLTEEAATDADSLRPLCEQAHRHLLARVAELDLVTVTRDEARIIPMPESHRGVAVAYCDPPGPLAPPGGVTLIAVAPPPDDWPRERRDSFYREYNAHMLRNLMVHEGVPGHALQLAHAARYTGGTRIRHALWSGPFVEGWAVYAEELVAGAGWTDSADLALRLFQLKTRLRVILNAILDVGVHAGDLTEAAAMELLVERGHQEEGEAVGKWRRAQLTSAQLATYYVGYREVADLARDLAAARPGAGRRELHDAMLAHGSPPPRHLRTLLGV